ncbi:organic solute transporter Ostalpha-domain-containing protein [Suillus occidentalis]|nr:organic solute transporter Ostalpha-domain-containing protein [Suillus occidentalis]
MAPTCPSDNTIAVDQSSFWNSGNLNWDEHRIGWAIAGGCTVLVCSSSLVHICPKNYTKPNEQRQILRILYMPPVYAVISFFSYRYFRSYTYYALIEVAFDQAVTLSAFLLLLIEFAIERKDKRPLPIPFCCWRYRPTKPYFMYTLKWSVLQYVIIRPAVSIAGIICQVYNVLCESGPYSIYFANVYLEAVDFVSISVALYGLLLFYGLTKEELTGRRPLAKFLSIKLIVMFTFYQSFIFSALEGRVIQATQYWTAANIADGLNALAICVEMVFFSILMMWAYTSNEYRIAGNKKTSIWRDFVTEIGGSLKFFFNYARGDSSTHSSKKMNFAQAFGVGSRSVADGDKSLTEESIRLAPYPYNDPRNADSASPVSP